MPVQYLDREPEELCLITPGVSDFINSCCSGSKSLVLSVISFPFS